MDAEQTISEIEWLERIFAVPDTRPLSASDLSAIGGVKDGPVLQTATPDYRSLFAVQ